MNATPRPWIYDYERRTIRKIEKGTGSKDDPIQYGMTLASLQQDLRMQPKQAEVNGEFIVRAVNSYDAMREALEVMKDEKEILAEKLAKLEKELAFYKAKNGDASVCHACDGTGWVYG